MYKRGEEDVKINMTYSQMKMMFHQVDETKPESSVFKFIWEFADDGERAKGTELLESLKTDFNEARIDDKGLVVVYMATELKSIVRYRRSEFGDIWELLVDQNNTKDVHFQFVVQKKDPNMDAFHDLVQKIIDGKSQLKFLSEQ